MSKPTQHYEGKIIYSVRFGGHIEHIPARSKKEALELGIKHFKVNKAFQHEIVVKRSKFD